MSNIYSQFVIYDRPKDYPSHFVVREPFIYLGQELPGIALLANSLQEARKLIPPGKIRMRRHPEDDPVIIETWI